jgi:hypothetical protein
MAYFAEACWPFGVYFAAIHGERTDTIRFLRPRRSWIPGKAALFSIFATLPGEKTKNSQQQKSTGYQKVVDLMPDTKGIIPHKKGNGSEDNERNGQYGTYPGCNSK